MWRRCFISEASTWRSSTRIPGGIRGWSNIQQRIVYILNLFPSELHIFVRPEINSLSDLKGKKVNFNTPGTAAAYSGPLIFDQLKLDVQKTFIPHQVAIEQMKAGTDDMAAVVFITSKPIDAFRNGNFPPGFKFLPVPFQDFEFYLPSTLTNRDYPKLIPEGQQIETIAVPTILASYNWPKSSDRFRRVARLTNYLFDRMGKLQNTRLPSRLERRQPCRAGSRPDPVQRGAGLA